MSLKLNKKYLSDFITDTELENMKESILLSNDILNTGRGAGSDFLGWLTLPEDYDKQEFDRIKLAAEKIKRDSEVLIVIGIGGSYLGAKSAIEFLSHSFSNKLSKEERKTPEIYFAGTNISGTYLQELVDIVGDRDFSINVISKSGTTTEPAIAFRVFKKLIEEKYGKEEASKRIYATTDKSKGALKVLSDNEGYETFVVPDNVGGRFSVLTAVGLLPIAAAGISIDELMAGAYTAMKDYDNVDYANNDVMQYAAIRNILYRKGKEIEIFVNYEPKLHFVSEWLKQLFAESEGKDNRGIYPSSADFSTDLHSIGQAIQEGRRTIFETVIAISKPEKDLVIEEAENDLDGLNYLSGKTIDYVNKQAMQGVILAHVDGGVPNVVLELPEASAYNLGYLYYFFEKVVALSGYTNGINPFNQPGVEAYKKNMFALLEKPGYEEATKEIKDRLNK